MLNDTKGVLRHEVQQLFTYLSNVMNIKSLLMEIAYSMHRLTCVG